MVSDLIEILKLRASFSGQQKKVDNYRGVVLALWSFRKLALVSGLCLEVLSTDARGGEPDAVAGPRAVSPAVPTGFSPDAVKNLNEQVRSPEMLIALKENYLRACQVTVRPKRLNQTLTGKASADAIAEKIQAKGSSSEKLAADIYAGLQETRRAARNSRQVVQLTEEFCRLNAGALSTSQPVGKRAAVAPAPRNAPARGLSEQGRLQNEVHDALEEIRRTSKTPAQLIQQNATFESLNSETLKQMASPSAQIQSSSPLSHE